MTFIIKCQSSNLFNDSRNLIKSHYIEETVSTYNMVMSSKEKAEAQII